MGEYQRENGDEQGVNESSQAQTVVVPGACVKKRDEELALYRREDVKGEEAHRGRFERRSCWWKVEKLRDVADGEIVEE